VTMAVRARGMENDWLQVWHAGASTLCRIRYRRELGHRQL
jgi:hypothetical protein